MKSFEEQEMKTYRPEGMYDAKVKEVPVTLRVDNWEYVIKMLVEANASNDMINKIREQL